MNLLDIVGPVMVGPSSSHTAGAARLGRMARKLLGEEVKSVWIGLHGSFAATGKGHGTDKALLAGLLGMEVDDERIPQSFEWAEVIGVDFKIENIVITGAHPNSVKMELVGETGRKLEMVGTSIGGGRIVVNELDGMKANFSGESPTLVVYNQDRPGCIVGATSKLGQAGINIGTMQVYRDERGGKAVMVIEVDQEVSADCIQALEQTDGIDKVTYLCMDSEVM